MRILNYLIIILLLASCAGEKAEFSTRAFRITISGEGQLIHLLDTRSGRDYLFSGQETHLLSVRIEGRVIPPSSMEILNGGNNLRFHFDTARVVVGMSVETRDSYVRFGITGVEPADRIEMVIWGPYPTTIGEMIGETVGVVRNGDYAIGLQALNPKTLGGYPWTDNDCMPQLDIFEGDDFSDLSEEGKRYVLYRVEAAKPDTFGSTLQAYCRNRLQDRIIENWDHPKYLAPAFDDGGVTGSAIALFGCPVEETLDYIETIEMEEGLPHPMIAGEWGKRSQAATSSYMILGFGEEDILQALDYTKAAGLKYLYHPGPFETWGHFTLNKQFPSGWDGLKQCVDKAHEQNVFLGVHTLSNFITPSDAYVTPVPDGRLAKVGTTMLERSVGPADTGITISDPNLFRPAKSISMRTVQIGRELIQYQKLSDSEPWILLSCERGAFGTTATAHETGAEVSLLADHAYNVFLSDADLTLEMAETIAGLFNTTGIRQVSFDGLEGNRSTGMGNYGEILMTNTWYEHLDADVKTHYIADASRTSHFFWHIYTRMNWGEPWYAGFRESQAEYRFRNQAYFQRNLMPGMLGWFLMTEKTSPEDIEWMLAKAAGYNAGFGFVCSYASLEGNGKSGEILALINRWETARMQRRFAGEIQELLRSTDMEYHLEEGPDGALTLWPVVVGRMDYSSRDRQPGETQWTKMEFDNTFDAQPLRFTVMVPDQLILRGLEIAVDNITVFRTNEKILAGEILRYNGGEKIEIFTPTWNLLRSLPVNAQDLIISGGDHTIALAVTGSGESEQPVKFEFKTTGNPKNIPNHE